MSSRFENGGHQPPEMQQMQPIAELAVTHPQTEGVFVPTDENYDAYVVDVHPYKEDKITPAGIIKYRNYRMSDGVEHHVTEGQPRIQRTSISADATTAWVTQPEGHNSVTDYGFLKLGMPFRRIGPEIIPVEGNVCLSGIFRSFRKGLAVDLGYTAHNILEILDTSDDEAEFPIEPGVSLWTGESRGAMVEPAVQLLAQQRFNKRLIAHSDTVDPCCAEKVKLTDPLKGLKLAASEFEAILRVGAHILKSGGIDHYKETVDFSLNNLIPTIAAYKGLLSGQAGEYADARPKDRPMHLTMMRRSYANDQEKFKEIYSDHPLVYIQMRGGGHLDIPRTRQGVLRRHGHIVDQLQKNGDNPANLDLDKIYMPPHKRGRGLLRLVAA